MYIKADMPVHVMAFGTGGLDARHNDSYLGRRWFRSPNQSINGDGKSFLYSYEHSKCKDRRWSSGWGCVVWTWRLLVRILLPFVNFSIRQPPVGHGLLSEKAMYIFILLIKKVKRWKIKQVHKLSNKSCPLDSDLHQESHGLRITAEANPKFHMKLRINSRFQPSRVSSWDENLNHDWGQFKQQQWNSCKNGNGRNGSCCWPSIHAKRSRSKFIACHITVAETAFTRAYAQIQNSFLEPASLRRMTYWSNPWTFPLTTIPDKFLISGNSFGHSAISELCNVKWTNIRN